MIADSLAVNQVRMMRRIRRLWPDVEAGLPQPFGPAGVSVPLHRKTPDGPQGSIIVSQAWHDGAEWLHASIAWAGMMPDYEDLAGLHDAVFGPEREVYQVFPAASHHVNIHETALHLWGRADGSSALPAFGAAGTI